MTWHASSSFSVSPLWPPVVFCSFNSLQAQNIPRHASPAISQQVALLLQRGRAMLCVRQKSVSTKLVRILLLSLLRRLQIYHCVTLSSAWHWGLLSYTSSLFPTINVLGRPPATSVINSPWSVAARCIARAAGTLHSMQWSQILTQNCVFCLPHVHLTPPLRGFASEYRHAVWYGKTRMMWLPDGEKNWRYVYLFWQNVRTWQTHTETDTHTPHDSIGRACIASRGKTAVSYNVFFEFLQVIFLRPPYWKLFFGQSRLQDFSQILRGEAVFRRISAMGQNVFLVFLMQFGLRQAAIFVSSPIHLLFWRLPLIVRYWTHAVN